MNGDDDNAGTSEGLALRSISAACSRKDVGTVMVRGYGASHPYYRGAGFDNLVLSRPINIIGHGDDLPYITTHDRLTFTRSRSTPGQVFEATRGNVSECVDMSSGGRGSLLTKVMDVVECGVVPGSWCESGSTIYVHAPDGRDLSTTRGADIWALLKTSNFKNLGDHTSYLEGLALYGGTDCVNTSGATPAGGRLTLVDVETALSQAFGGNNVSAWGVDAVLTGCKTFWSGQDGFNYHALNGKLPKIVEIDCRADHCGHSASDQCSSAHDGAKIIRVGGVYTNSVASNIADINGMEDATESWNLGCVAEASGGGFANFQCGIPEDTGAGPKMWLHHCTAGGPDYSTSAFAGGEIFTRDSSLLSNQSTIRSY